MASDEQVIKGVRLLFLRLYSSVLLDKERVLQTSTPFIRTSVQSVQGGQLDGSLFEIPKKQDSLETSLLDQTSRHEETISEHSSTNVTQLNAGFINSTSMCSESESIIQHETDRGHLDAIIEEEEEQPPAIAASDTDNAAIAASDTDNATVKTETDTAKIDTAEIDLHASETDTYTAQTETDTAKIDTAEIDIHASETDTHTAQTETDTETHTTENTMNTEEAETDTRTSMKSTKVTRESSSRYIESKTEQPEKQRKRKRLTKVVFNFTLILVEINELCFIVISILIII